jgi:predicted alpha/beta superfamily hydrolase
LIDLLTHLSADSTSFGTETSVLPFDPATDGSVYTFEPLPPGENEPSELDENPRFLRLQIFRSRFLPGRRDIVVYLPEAYLADPTRRFPVFYLHDGQNLIDGRTSFVAHRTWQADTAADTLTRANEIEPIILVGINNTGVRRMAEYTHTRDPRRGGGEGSRYGRLLVQELKPLIDHTFRTLPDAANTAIGGSSLGGLVSLSIALDYPDVFGKAAVLSPSVWWNQRAILHRVGGARPRPNVRIWLDMGTAEGLRHLRDTDLLYRRLLQRGWRDSPLHTTWHHATNTPPDLHYLRVPNALHDESAWAARFPDVLRFLFPSHPKPLFLDAPNNLSS